MWKKLLLAIIAGILVFPFASAVTYTSTNYVIEEVDQVDSHNLNSTSYSTSFFDENALKALSLSYQLGLGLVYTFDDDNAPYNLQTYPAADQGDNNLSNPVAFVHLSDNETRIKGCEVDVYVDDVLSESVYVDVNDGNFCNYTFSLAEDESGYAEFTGIDWGGNVTGALTSAKFFLDLLGDIMGISPDRFFGDYDPRVGDKNQFVGEYDEGTKDSNDYRSEYDKRAQLVSVGNATLSAGEGNDFWETIPLYLTIGVIVVIGLVLILWSERK